MKDRLIFSVSAPNGAVSQNNIRQLFTGVAQIFQLSLHYPPNVISSKDYNLRLMSSLSKTSFYFKYIMNTLKNIWKYYPLCQKQYFSLLSSFHKGFYYILFHLLLFKGACRRCSSQRNEPRRPNCGSINDCKRPSLIKGDFPLVQILHKRLTDFPILFPSTCTRDMGTGIRKRTELPDKFRHSPNAHAMGFLSSCFNSCLPLKNNL